MDNPFNEIYKEEGGGIDKRYEPDYTEPSSVDKIKTMVDFIDLQGKLIMSLSVVFIFMFWKPEYMSTHLFTGTVIFGLSFILCFYIFFAINQIEYKETVPVRARAWYVLNFIIFLFIFGMFAVKYYHLNMNPKQI